MSARQRQVDVFFINLDSRHPTSFVAKAPRFIIYVFPNPYTSTSQLYGCSKERKEKFA